MSRDMIINGRKNVNPFGSCFDSTAKTFLTHHGDNMVICHGIGIANHPDDLGKTIAHAWIEYDHSKHGRVALDCIFMLGSPAKKYRKDLQVSYCVEYNLEEFMRLWLKHDMPGPFDEKIKAVISS